MRIQWYGHSCFLLTNEAGVRVLTDPCAPETGYRIAGAEAEIVTLSHDHFDHNYIAGVSGAPFVVRTAGRFEHAGVKITAVESFHDAFGGTQRGKNLICVIETDDLRLVHLGDLGCIPDEFTLAKVGHADVLFVPVGGHYTIAADEARRVANLLGPKVLIPMHYRTAACSLDIAGVEPLLLHASGCKIHRLNESECSIARDSLGEDRILVLDYCG